MEKKPKCTCGECNVCKTRERMRKLRQVKAVNAAQSEYVTATTPNKKALENRVNSGLKELSQRINKKINNLGLWIKGADRHNFEGLEHAIDAVSRDYDSQVRELRTRVQQHHIKTIKGQDYIYSKYNGETHYHGKNDPRPELEERAHLLELEAAEKVADMRSCVIKQIGDHYVVNLEQFKKHIKGSRADLVKLSEVLT